MYMILEKVYVETYRKNGNDVEVLNSELINICEISYSEDFIEICADVEEAKICSVNAYKMKEIKEIVDSGSEYLLDRYSHTSITTNRAIGLVTNQMHLVRTYELVKE